MLAVFFLAVPGRAQEPTVTPGYDTSQDHAPERRYFVIELCDFTGLGTDALRWVRNQVTQIFQRGGIDIIWTECGQNPYFKICPAYGARVYLLRRLSDRFEENKRDMACVFAASTQPPGPLVLISRGSVEEFIGRWRARNATMVSRALGRAMAHELAHRFLQCTSHTKRGILKAGFGRNELTQALPKALFFTREQMELMRSYAPTALELRQQLLHRAAPE